MKIKQAAIVLMLALVLCLAYAWHQDEVRRAYYMGNANGFREGVAESVELLQP